MALAMAPPVMTPPAMAAPVESAIEAPGPLGPLRGTLLQPSDNAPVALILPGSGETDRDGNGPGVRAAPLRLLAEGLAQRGIASVRIDKRGLGGSKSAVVDPNDVTIADYAADTRRWIDVTLRQTGVHCVWLIGHSEGGLIATAAAAGGTGVCGIVMLAAPGRPLAEIVRAQLRGNTANKPLLPDAMAAIARLEAGQRVDVSSMNPALKRLFAPEIQRFWIDVFAYDPAAMLARFRKPVLILQGDRDLQIGVVDATNLARANPSARLEILPGVNHALKIVSSNKVADNLATYSRRGLPLAPGIVDRIARFILSGGTD